MTPDTAALRARPTYSRAAHGVLITEAERDALCDAADEVERLRIAVAERDTRLAETIRYHDARVNRADEATDAARTAHAALVADLRSLLVTWAEKPLDPWDWGEPADDLRALLDRHAPEEEK